jgi:hypothetical protein
MRSKARGLVQPDGPPVWLEESDPAGCDFVRDGRSMPPALTDHTTCPGLGLIYYGMYTEHRHGLRRTKKAWHGGTLVDPCLLCGGPLSPRPPPPPSIKKNYTVKIVQDRLPVPTVGLS